MPVRQVKIDGKNGFKWGKTGKFYPYTPGNAASMKRAKQRAIDQGLAVAYKEGTKPEL